MHFGLNLIILTNKTNVKFFLNVHIIESSLNYNYKKMAK